MAEIKNAIITEARIDDGERGMLTAWLMLDYGGTHQGFGGYALYLPAKSYKNGGASGGNYAGVFLHRCMEIADVSDWSKITGKTCRALVEDGRIQAIGHIVKDDWFNPREVFDEIGGSNV